MGGRAILEVDENAADGAIDIFYQFRTMQSMRVKILPEAYRQITGVPLSIHRRVLGILERLEHWPAVSGAKPLAGPLAGHYRIRTGDYRVQFRVEANEVIVEKVGHRDRFYD